MPWKRKYIVIGLKLVYFGIIVYNREVSGIGRRRPLMSIGKSLTGVRFGFFVHIQSRQTYFFSLDLFLDD